MSTIGDLYSPVLFIFKPTAAADIIRLQPTYIHIKEQDRNYRRILCIDTEHKVIFVTKVNHCKYCGFILEITNTLRSSGNSIYVDKVFIISTMKPRRCGL